MRRFWIGWAAAVVIAVGGSAFAYLFWFAGGSGDPSTELTTPGLPPTTSVDGAETTQEVGDSASDVSTVSYVIDQTQSRARFEINEELRGEDNTVVGTTDQVVGQVRFDSTDLSTVEVSDIVINARTLATNSEQRNRAMRGPVILDSASDEFELIIFSVTSVDGLSGEAVIGDEMAFIINGDLTIKGTTQTVAFDVLATLVDESTLQGTSTSVITRAQFGIGIPNVPGVANVAEEVTIGLDFVASKVR